MAGRLPIFAASTLVFLSRAALAIDSVGGDSVRIEARRIPLTTDLSRPQSTNPTLTQRPGTSTRSTRVLFIIKKDCDRCTDELSRLNAAGGQFEIMKALGWKIGTEPSNHIQIIDGEEIPEIVRKLRVREYPTVACIENDEIVRSFKDGCTTPLDSWTFGWLIKGKSERPQSSIPESARVETTGNYRLRGNHWTLEGDPTPTKQSVLNHLRGPSHAHSSGAYGTLENWSYEELRSLHDDLHEREGTYPAYGQMQYQSPAANVNLNAFSGSRKVTGK